MPEHSNCLILGAAGRDFHDFLVFFRQRPWLRVCAFTAAQIPFIAERAFPAALAGPDYPEGIPIYPEEMLPELIRKHAIDVVFLAYSDLAHEEVMHKASLVLSCGAGFALLGPRQTQLVSRRPVVAVTAVRTGAGKSPLTQHLAGRLHAAGWRVAVVRHPMPYGRPEKQVVQRLATPADLDRHQCTVEEREEYQPYLEQGLPVFAGVDYRQVLRAAEEEHDLLLWDGGNNDLPFFRPDVWLTLADCLRPGHELQYHPGEANFRAADLIAFTKVSAAKPEDLQAMRQRAAAVNPRAAIVEADLEIDVDRPAVIAGRRVLVVEDGPTLTHGGMAFGAGLLAARRYGAGEIVDPRPVAVGTIAETFRQYPHLHSVLPALGYSDRQLHDLAATIDASGAEVLVDASPARLDRVLQIRMPVVRVRYRFVQRTGPAIEEFCLARLPARGSTCR